ncbi:MAG: ferrous iron transport protein A [Actinomycetia bacterium]|nr:ferrous iron transport protein A [Actinomycetes bacterium]MCP4958548.1 ferrous iron transport protein A [Actinomycetes bacterium]
MCPTRLSQLPTGSHAVVLGVDQGPSGEGRRLQEIGFVPGTPVIVERKAPLGDPIVFEVRSTRLALRRRAADLIEVELTGEPTG